MPGERLEPGLVLGWGILGSMCSFGVGAVHGIVDGMPDLNIKSLETMLLYVEETTRKIPFSSYVPNLHKLVSIGTPILVGAYAGTGPHENVRSRLVRGAKVGTAAAIAVAVGYGIGYGVSRGTSELYKIIT